MSHGGMGGGGGHGHGGGYGGHGHGHNGAMSGHHADQSPTWNMAMQVEKDGTGKRLGGIDPRILVFVTLVVFVMLITLPYTMDFLQNQHYDKRQGATADAPQAESSGPNSAALSMVGATLMGHSVRLEDAGFGAQAQPVKAMAPAAAPAAATAPSEYGAPEVASNAANDTISQMVAASGMSSGTRGASPAVSGSAAYGSSIVNPAAQSALAQTDVTYGGAVRTNDHYIYMPGQQAYGAAAPVQNVAAQRANANQLAALPAGMAGGRGGMDRSPYNAQTSAIVCPMGMRRHPAEAIVPLVPSAATGADGSQRPRVWASR